MISCSQPNMLVVPPQLLLYMALAPEEKVSAMPYIPCNPTRNGHLSSVF